MKAPDFCTKAAALMEDRGKERDQADGERSMARCVNAFNAMTGHQLSVEDGWLFMVYLKHARMRGGQFKQDDYEDAVAYEALMAEEATAAQPPDLSPREYFEQFISKKPASPAYHKPESFGTLIAETEHAYPATRDECGPLMDCSKCKNPCQ